MVDEVKHKEICVIAGYAAPKDKSDIEEAPLSKRDAILYQIFKKKGDDWEKSKEHSNPFFLMYGDLKLEVDPTNAILHLVNEEFGDEKEIGIFVNQKIGVFAQADRQAGKLVPLKKEQLKMLYEDKHLNLEKKEVEDNQIVIIRSRRITRLTFDASKRFTNS